MQNETADQPDTHHPFGATRSGLVDRRAHGLMTDISERTYARHHFDDNSGFGVVYFKAPAYLAAAILQEVRRCLRCGAVES